MPKTLLFLLASIFLSGCSDNSITKLYDKNFSNPPCLKVVVFPPDKMILTNINNLYKFDDNCEYKLQIEKKAGITCNSTHNTGKKTTSNFPSGFLKMNVSKDSKNLYTYYIDLTKPPTKNDVEDAFLRVKKDLKLK